MEYLPLAHPNGRSSSQQQANKPTSHLTNNATSNASSQQTNTPTSKASRQEANNTNQEDDNAPRDQTIASARTSAPKLRKCRRALIISHQCETQLPLQSRSALSLSCECSTQSPLNLTHWLEDVGRAVLFKVGFRWILGYGCLADAMLGFGFRVAC